MSIATSIDIPLAVSIAVLREGTATKLDRLTLRRPTTGQAKRLLALLGADLAKAFFADAGSEAGLKDLEDFDLGKFATETVPLLLTQERLDAISTIMAESCSITAKEFDEIDLLDIGAVAKGFLGFFPQLQSIASANSKPTSP